MIDSLTRLRSRGALEVALAALTPDDPPGAVMLLDLDHFKLVNDRFGHRAGDEVLVTVARRLEAARPAGATAFRVGGEEFALLVPGCDLQSAAGTARAVCAAVAEPMSVAGALRVVTASIGVARTPRSKPHYSLVNADRCLYAAKTSGRNSVVTEDDLGEVRSGRYDVVQQIHQLQDQRDALAVQAITDELTGLRNRRAFDDALPRLHSTAEREAMPYAVVYLDLDRFHDLNRARGDAAGDEALRACAWALTDACRTAEDVVYRKGGEELVALLPGADLAAAGVVAERMREAVRATRVPYEDRPGSSVVTVSAGYAAYDATHPRTADELVDAANQAMVRAKTEGRDRVLPG